MRKNAPFVKIFPYKILEMPLNHFNSPRSKGKAGRAASFIKSYTW